MPRSRFVRLFLGFCMLLLSPFQAAQAIPAANLFAVADTYATEIETPLTVAAPGVLANDYAAWENTGSGRVGGGFTNAGLDGEYFANPDLSGQPAFTRRDVRIDFDWGAQLQVGGSNTRAFKNFPHDNFSIRWSGQVIPRFNESYTFKTTADDGIQLYIRPEGTTPWHTLVDHWAASGTFESDPYPMTARQRYDLRVEYRDLSGEAQVVLEWASQSTPAELIEPAVETAINAATFGSSVWAEQMKVSNAMWLNGNAPLPPDDLDADGWPLRDASHYLWDYNSAGQMSGTYLVNFNGKAELWIWPNGRFILDEQIYTDTLPSGLGYITATNITSVTVDIPASSGHAALRFYNSQRTAASPLNTGITNLEVWRPLSTGSTQYHTPGTVVMTQAKEAFRNFTSLRWIDFGFSDEIHWDDRTEPGDLQFDKGLWEYLVMLANETGKDLYLCTPARATDEYLTNLANLLRYGSDGHQPYTSPQANPLYPPLNPNLRVYLEYGNEIWNFGFAMFGWAAEASRQAVHDNTPDGQIINFDGQVPDGDWQRWWGLRTVRTSQIFRQVFGDAEMEKRIRVLAEFQYTNSGAFAPMFEFLDNYFNNGDGIQHVAIPRPVSYYIWGGGGAVYYGSANPLGEQEEIVFANASFETPAIPEHTRVVAPAGAAWAFSGEAGIYHNLSRASILASTTPGTLSHSLPGGARFVGYCFTVGAQDLIAYDVGRWVAADNTHNHTVYLVRASDNAVLAETRLDTQGATPGQYLYAPIITPGWYSDHRRPVRLEAGETYYLASAENEGEDGFYLDDTTLVAHTGITITAAATSSDLYTWNTAAAGNHAFGPVDFRYTTIPLGAMDFPPDAVDGTQTAFIGSTGAMSQTIHFPAAGTYALFFYGGGHKDSTRWNGGSTPVDMYVDGVKITPRSFQRDWRANGEPWWPGAWEKPYDELLTWCSATFTVDTPGPRTIRIVGHGDVEGLYLYLDQIQIVSVDSIFGPNNENFPTMGEALGQPQAGIENYKNTLRVEANFARAWGLHVVSYEGGWSLGGDVNALTIQSHAKYLDERAAQVNRTSMDIFARSGGELYAFGTYDQWPAFELDQPESYALMQGIIAVNQDLPPEPTNGKTAPAYIQPAETTVYSGWDNSPQLETYEWRVWNIIIPQTGNYLVTAVTSPGGELRLAANDAATIATGASGGEQAGTVFLTKGYHTIKLKATAGEFRLYSLRIQLAGTPYAPAIGLVVNAGNGVAHLAWNAAPGASGYRLDYGITSGVYTATLDAGNVTDLDITGLDSELWYFQLYPYNAAGLGLGSGEQSALVLNAGDEGALALWDFTGLIGEDLEGPVASYVLPALGDSPALAVTRGPGLRSDWEWFEHLSAGASGGGTLAATLPEAIASQQYFQFAITPATGRSVSLAELALHLDAPEACGLALTYSTDGVNFSSPIPATAGEGRWREIALDGEANLQGQTQPIAVRLYPFTNGATVGNWGIGGSPATTDISLSGSYTVSDANQNPAIVSIAALPNPTGQITATLSALGADDGGEANLTYHWRVMSKPSPQTPWPTFSANGSNTAKQTRITFAEAGPYLVRVTASDAAGLDGYREVWVQVAPTLSRLAVNPTGSHLEVNTELAFTANAFDQFDRLMPNPSLLWNVAPGGAGGSIVADSGLYSAPASPGLETISVSTAGMTTTFTATVTATDGGPLTAWGDLGAPAESGATSFASGAYTLSGNGTGFKWTDADQYHHATLRVTGEFTFTARLTSLSGNNHWAMHTGLIVRESSSLSARYIAVSVNSDGLGFWRRLQVGADSGGRDIAAAGIPPAWLRLTRHGDDFRGYYSTDGATWIQLTTWWEPDAVHLSLPDTLELGLFVAGGMDNQRQTAVFDQLTLQSTQQLAAQATAPRPPAALTAVLDTSPAVGVLDFHPDGSFTYTPPVGFIGEVTFTYHVTDGVANSNTATVTITVTPQRLFLPLISRD